VGLRSAIRVRKGKIPEGEVVARLYLQAGHGEQVPESEGLNKAYQSAGACQGKWKSEGAWPPYNDISSFIPG